MRRGRRPKPLSPRRARRRPVTRRHAFGGCLSGSCLTRWRSRGSRSCAIRPPPPLVRSSVIHPQPLLGPPRRIPRVAVVPALPEPAGLRIGACAAAGGIRRRGADWSLGSCRPSTHGRTPRVGLGRRLPAHQATYGARWYAAGAPARRVTGGWVGLKRHASEVDEAQLLDARVLPKLRHLRLIRASIQIAAHEPR